MAEKVLLSCLLVLLPPIVSRRAEAYELTLQNDGWTDGSSLGCQGGFVSGEEAAVTLGPVESAYAIQRIQFIFCGSGDTVTMTLKIYQESGGSNPGTVLYEADYGVTGADDAMQEIDISSENVSLPGGSAVRVSLLFNHSGFPGVARDDDGTIVPGVNWIKASSVGWNNSEMFGLTGDWIMRAVVFVESGGEDAGVGPADGSVLDDGWVGADGGGADGGIQPDAAAGCTRTEDCPGGYICLNGRCAAVCENNEDCGGGEICDNGVCVPVCSHSSDCSGGEVCEDGRCVVFCVSNTDCGGGEVCKANRCVSAEDDGGGGCGCRTGYGSGSKPPVLFFIVLLMGLARFERMHCGMYGQRFRRKAK